MTDTLIREFVREQKELLELELNSEQDEAGLNEDASSSQRTVALRQLEASDISVGLYGRTVAKLTLIPNDAKSGGAPPLLPAHRFTVGDDVEIHSKQQGKNNPQGGVICAATDSAISVALFEKNQRYNANSNSNNDTKSNAKNNNSSNKPSTNNDDDLGENSILGNPPLTLIPKNSVEVHRKLVAGLAELERHGSNHPIAGHLVQALFLPPSMTRQKPSRSDDSIQQPFNENLDSSQLEAISFALLDDRPVALIHGPPGTGKTTTVAELIQQAVHNHGMRVLVTAPSNVAVDNVLERLAASSTISKKKPKGFSKQSSTKHKPLRMVRLGHPARIKPSILRYSLEALVQSHDGTEIVQDVRSELRSFLRILNNPKSRGNDKRLAYREVKSLRKEVRTREEKVVKDLISKSQVVLATTVGAASHLLKSVADPTGNNGSSNKNAGFDLVIIDEAAQALEASCWIPILKGRKLVLAGDHCQLPPTIMSKHSKVQAGLGKTLFERLMKLYGDDKKNGKKEDGHDNQHQPQVSRMLKVQYRMHEDISNWASEASYHGDLMTHESVRHRTIGQLLKQADNDNDEEALDDDNDDDDVISNVALLLVDTAGCGMHETESASGSRFNQGEAEVVARHVQKLLDKGMRQEQIAIITPYNGQVELLRTMLLPDHPKLEIRSVDGFQGGEREAVVLSLVRSSERGGKKGGDGIGFLRDNRRLNVAVTRAKRHCAVICDSETVSQSKFVKNLISWMEEHGEQRSALDFLSGATNNDMKDDLRDAEIELQKAINKKSAPRPKANKSEPNKMDDEAKRKELLDKIATFSETGKQGEEMTLSSELTSFDRRVVHEFAEQIGIGHRSEGEGEDRRIILRIEKASPVAPSSNAANEAKEQAESKDDSNDLLPAKSTGFAALAQDDDDDDDDDDNESDNAEEQKIESDKKIDEQGRDEPGATTNSLLSSLGRERELRAKEQQKKAQAPPAPPGSSFAKKSNNKKGQKLGGKKPPPKKPEPNDVDDDLDDLAFLDKQIEKVQTSHGRKVVGSGSNYKTVINGILIAKPSPNEKEKNNKAASALQSKLKKAQAERKAKTKKK